MRTTDHDRPVDRHRTYVGQPHCCRLDRFVSLHLVRYRSLRQQLTIATLLPVVAVATTVLINVQLMFLSAHDSLVILIALVVSPPCCARRLAGGTSDLGCFAALGRACTSSSRTRHGTSVVADSVEIAAAPREPRTNAGRLG